MTKTPPKAENAVSAADLSLARGENRVVDGVSFALAPAGAIALRGDTGSGSRRWHPSSHMPTAASA